MGSPIRIQSDQNLIERFSRMSWGLVALICGIAFIGSLAVYSAGGGNLSPWAVVTYLLGGKLDNGFEIEPKYFGSRRLMEIAVATLATDRALLLIGWNKSTKSNAPIVRNGFMVERAPFMFY